MNFKTMEAQELDKILKREVVLNKNTLDLFGWNEHTNDYKENESLGDFVFMGETKSARMTLNKAQNGKYEIVPSETNTGLTLYLGDKGKTYFIHSKYNDRSYPIAHLMT